MTLLAEPSPEFDLLCGAIARAHPSLPLHEVEDTARHYGLNDGIAYTALCVLAGSEPQARLDAKVAAHEDYATVSLVVTAADRSNWGISIAAGAALIVEAITADVADGLIPWDVPDFSALHDFVDGNVYGLVVLEQIGWAFDMADDEQYRWICAVEEIVNRRLGGTRPPRWDIDPEGYRAWVRRAKAGLLDSRAEGFGMTRQQMLAHDAPEDL